MMLIPKRCVIILLRGRRSTRSQRQVDVGIEPERHKQVGLRHRYQRLVLRQLHPDVFRHLVTTVADANGVTSHREVAR